MMRFQFLTIMSIPPPSLIFLSIAAIAAYFFVGAAIGRRVMHGQAPNPRLRQLLFAGTIPAAVLHAFILYQSMLGQGLNLGITYSVSLVSWVVVILFLLAAARRPVETLGVFILPFAAAMLLLAAVVPSAPIPLPPQTTGFMVLHIIVSLLAYGLLSIAVVQSLALSLQERQLHSKHPAGFLRALPPIETMETLMFQMIGVGFLLLTLTLISGLFFSEQVFGKPVAFTHHIVLSIIAWVVFAVLLFGRVRFGWRGRHAVRWALSGFSLLVLAYFGSKFVIEVILAR